MVVPTNSCCTHPVSGPEREVAVVALVVPLRVDPMGVAPAARGPHPSGRGPVHHLEEQLPLLLQVPVYDVVPP